MKNVDGQEIEYCEACGWRLESDGSCSHKHEPRDPYGPRVRMDTQTLNAFLDLFHWVMPNLNDTFGYASADSEKLYMDGDPNGNQGTLVAVVSRFGHAGLIAYCAKVRGCEPLEELQTPDYRAAKAALGGWTYEQD